MSGDAAAAWVDVICEPRRLPWRKEKVMKRYAVPGLLLLAMISSEAAFAQK